MGAGWALSCMYVCIVLFYLFYVKLNADFFFSKRSMRLENLAINCLSATTQTCAMVVLT